MKKEAIQDRNLADIISDVFNSSDDDSDDNYGEEEDDEDSLPSQN